MNEDSHCLACSPDKHPNNPTATKRFERLGVIIKILRDERRDRYDHFLTYVSPPLILPL